MPVIPITTRVRPTLPNRKRCNSTVLESSTVARSMTAAISAGNALRIATAGSEVLPLPHPGVQRATEISKASGSGPAKPAGARRAPRRPRATMDLRAGQLRAQVERLGSREGLVTHTRQCAAAAGILDTGPGERGIEIVAAVHEPRPRLYAPADGNGGVLVGRPHRRREAVGAVVHERDGFLVVAHLHDADHRAEALLDHDPHGMIDVH